MLTSKDEKSPKPPFELPKSKKKKTETAINAEIAWDSVKSGLFTFEMTEFSRYSRYRLEIRALIHSQVFFTFISVC